MNRFFNIIRYRLTVLAKRTVYRLSQLNNTLKTIISDKTSRVFNKSRNFLENINNQYVLILMLFSLGFAYLMDFSFSAPEKVKVTVGTSLQLFAGGILVLAQIINTKGIKDTLTNILESYITNKTGKILLSCHIILIFVFIILYTVTVNDTSPIGIVFASIFIASIVSIIYILSIKVVTKILNKIRKKFPYTSTNDTERIIRNTNIIFFILSVPLTSLIVYYLINVSYTWISGVLSLLLIIFIVPILLLSTFYFIVKFILNLYNAVNSELKFRVIWWIIIGLLWVSGGLILLSNGILSK